MKNNLASPFDHQNMKSSGGFNSGCFDTFDRSPNMRKFTPTDDMKMSHMTNGLSMSNIKRPLFANENEG